MNTTTRALGSLPDPNPSRHPDARMNLTLKDMRAMMSVRSDSVVRYCGELGSPEKDDHK
jgi:hypothetical protein